MEQNNIFLPSLKAHIGDWIYYSTIMKFSEVNARVRFAEEIHESKKLQELIQRSLTSRGSEISEYILNQPQRFFNSLIVGVYEGDPEWIELKVTSSLNLPELTVSQKGILGFLKLTGREKLFAIDGQHRVSGIKEVLKKLPTNNSISNEEISVLFIGHKNNPEGISRTRRLFTTLNRYAKPVQLSEIIALDEDDICAIITRELINNFSLFKNDRISLSKTNSIPLRDEECFTNIVTLYKSIDLILKAFLKKKNIFKKSWVKFKIIRPEQEILKISIKFCQDIWNKITETFQVIDDYLKIPASSKLKSQKYRNRKGGQILFRPIGLLIYFKVLSIVKYNNLNLDEIIVKLSRLESELSKFPWKGLLWGGVKEGMITDSENQKVARDLILYMVNIDLAYVKSDENKLLEQYSKALNKEIQEVKLPEKIKI